MMPLLLLAWTLSNMHAKPFSPDLFRNHLSIFNFSSFNFLLFQKYTTQQHNTVPCSSLSTFQIINIQQPHSNIFHPVTSYPSPSKCSPNNCIIRPHSSYSSLHHRLVTTSSTRLSMYSCSNAFRIHPPLTLQPFPIQRRPRSPYATSDG